MDKLQFSHEVKIKKKLTVSVRKLRQKYVKQRKRKLKAQEQSCLLKTIRILNNNKMKFNISNNPAAFINDCSNFDEKALNDLLEDLTDDDVKELADLIYENLLRRYSLSIIPDFQSDDHGKDLAINKLSDQNANEHVSNISVENRLKDSETLNEISLDMDEDCNIVPPHISNDTLPLEKSIKSSNLTDINMPLPFSHRTLAEKPAANMSIKCLTASIVNLLNVNDDLQPTNVSNHVEHDSIEESPSSPDPVEQVPYDDFEPLDIPLEPTNNRFDSVLKTSHPSEENCDNLIVSNNIGVKRKKSNSPECVVKRRKSSHPGVIHRQNIGNLLRIPKSIDFKEWRKNLLDIAEVTLENRYQDIKSAIDNVEKNYTQTLIKGQKVPIFVTKLLTELLNIPNEDIIPKGIINKLKKYTSDQVIEIIIHQLKNDIHTKPDSKYYPAPLMTRTQRIFLGLLIELEKLNKFKGIALRYLARLETYLFFSTERQCVKATLSLTRLYLSVCRLLGDINRMRAFCCLAFFYCDHSAVPILFTILKSWIEVIPLYKDVETFPIAKLLHKLVHTDIFTRKHSCSFPLKCLLSVYHGYPRQTPHRDKIIEDLVEEYTTNPSQGSDYSIRLLCKHTNANWVYKVLDKYFKPLLYKIPSENVNFKATTIVLMGRISSKFQVKNGKNNTKIVEDLKRFFEGLLQDESNSDELIRQSIIWSMNCFLNDT
ncbi:unnamed protein product [Phyllotreta striolata]|uniref:Uncharacterized protein n=1 Tax=Phyllotreta striolata TaxID=444603 RepID=A0A9N9TQ48_PHYSR|nr:unnamed protein product [Phyllotreta striolata]